MKNTICCLLCLNVFLSFGLKNGNNSPVRDESRPHKVWLGFAPGFYWNSVSGEGQDPNASSSPPPGFLFAMVMDCRIAPKWEIGLQQQVGIWGENLKDMDFSLFGIRSFFRHDNLRLGMGMGFGSRERFQNGMTQISNRFTIPIKTDLRLFQRGCLSLALSAGIVTEYYGEIGVNAAYVAPVFRVSL